MGGLFFLVLRQFFVLRRFDSCSLSPIHFMVLSNFHFCYVQELLSAKGMLLQTLTHLEERFDAAGACWQHVSKHAPPPGGRYFFLFFFVV